MGAKMIDGHGLGRMPSEDERDRMFMLAPLADTAAAAQPDRTWRYWNANGWWGDQGNTPQCVGYSWAHWIEDGPITHPGTAPIVHPTPLYQRAQQLDEWPGENYDGTSVRGGVKALRELGYVASFFWAWDAETIVDTLLYLGPVVVGTWWYRQMFYPDSKGMLTVSGRRDGGHAYVLNGVNTNRGIVRVKNSWGRSWGNRGYAYVTIADLDRLIKEDGEACLATELQPHMTP